MLSGRDLLGAAQTGTGKTAGFTLPLLQRLSAAPSGAAARHPVRALILVPTRELAAQVQDSVRAYGRHLSLRSTVLFGGVGFAPQVEALSRGADIVVATPGRLLDHAAQRTIDLRQVEVLVLDEADRMLDMGFLPAIRRVLALLPAKRQNLLFSATFPEEIRALARSFMHDPATVEVAPRNRPIERIAQAVYPVPRERKRELLARLVTANDWRQVLVFTRTKHGANRLARQLGHDGIEADAIHGNKSQNARTRALRQFKDNALRVLVATDIAARGLDIEELPHVVNFELPHVPEDYVHRIGRTGRAGAAGEAVSLVSPEERPLLAAIERLIGRRIEERAAPGFGNGAPRNAAASPAPSGDANATRHTTRTEASPGARRRRRRGRRTATPSHGERVHSRTERHPSGPASGESVTRPSRSDRGQPSPAALAAPAEPRPAAGSRFPAFLGALFGRRRD